jgi:hypothetical protein
MKALVIVPQAVTQLSASGTHRRDCPYAAQVRLLREQLAVPGLEIDRVDGFQGREKRWW